MTSNFEKFFVYLSLVCGTLFALLTKAGLEFLNEGDTLRAFVFALISMLTLMGWIGPLFNSWRSVGLKSGCLLAVLLVLLSVLDVVRENFITSLPKIWL